MTGRPHRTPVLPPATIGMLGGGQLGRYALMAAASMGYRTLVVDPDPSAPTGVVANEQLVTAYDHPSSLERLGRDCAVVTTEFENPPAAALRFLEQHTVVAPSGRAVGVAQDRIAEKRFLGENGVPVAPYGVLADASVPDRSSDADERPDEWFVLHESVGPDLAIADAVDDLVDGGAIVKIARLGYDGKGQVGVGTRAEMLAAWADLGGVACVVEHRMDLVGEVSVIVGRTGDGHVRTWPVTENHHVDGILDLSVAPARVSADVADRAVGLAMAVADALAYVGVLAVEMFVVGGGDLIVNELAPRPHNSGHWTLDAAATSQFEQQVRAVCGVELGSTAMTAPAAAMVNLLGDLWFDGDGRRRDPDWSRVFATPDASLHLYGKSEPRPGRKMGHLTVTAETPDLAARAALTARDRLTET